VAALVGIVIAGIPAEIRAQWARASPAVALLRHELAAVFNAPIFAHATWAVVVESLPTGEVLYELNRSKLMMPASNMKIVTMAVAAETLGWDYRYETQLVSAAPVEAGVLQGDLVVVGSGDPSINGRYGAPARVFEKWADQLSAAGVTAIDGRIIGDDNRFDDDHLGPGWSWDYLAYGYAAPVGALQFRESIATLAIAPGTAPGLPILASLDSADAGLSVINRAVTGASGSRSVLDYRRLPGQSALEVRGSLPVGAAQATRTVAVDNPTKYFVESLRTVLRGRGIDVRGEAVDIDELKTVGATHASPLPDGVRVLARHASAPLADIGTLLMKVSHNLYAESLLKTVGATRGPGSVESGRAVAHEVLGRWGVKPDTYVLADGSGLSRYNYVTAGTISAVLRRMYEDPRHRAAFAATLPVAGRDGTLSNRMKKTRAAGNARAKTGSIANVRSLSGYVWTRSGEPIVFSIIANDFVVPSATIDYAVDLAVEILANFTGTSSNTPRGPRS